MNTFDNGRTIVLGEEDLEVRSYLETALRCQGYRVEVADTREEIVASVGTEEPVAAVVMNVVLAQRNGIDPLAEIGRHREDLPVVLISGSAPRLNSAATAHGAPDFTANPIHPHDVRKALQMVIGTNGTPSAAAAEPAVAPLNKQVFFGTAPKIRELQSLINQIGWSDAPVLIQGETGSGKEVFARELHARSPRAKRTLLKLNCAALPSELVESELFGYERGAFTGAFQKKAGMFELADGGTIMLDEIGDMDFRLQAKLLQVLQDQEFQRLGGKETIRVDVRVIAATHCDLEAAIAEGKFREDLYYRLNVVTLRVPPLRERREDILPLAEFLARKHSPAGSPPVKFPPVLRELLFRYSWPGNIRQLENTIRKFLIIGDSRMIERELLSKLSPGLATPPPEAAPPPLPERVDPPAQPVNGTNDAAAQALPSAEATGSVLQYSWTGNLGQSEHTVRKFFIIGDSRWMGRELQSQASPGLATPPPEAAPSPLSERVEPAARPVNGTNGIAAQTLPPAEAAGSVLQQVAKAKREAERTAILGTLETTNWNRRQAAVLLQIDYKALLYKMKVLDIRKEKTAP